MTVRQWFLVYLMVGVVAAFLSYESDDSLRDRVLGVLCALMLWPVMLLLGIAWGDEL